MCLSNIKIWRNFCRIRLNAIVWQWRDAVLFLFVAAMSYGYLNSALRGNGVFALSSHSSLDPYRVYYEDFGIKLISHVSLAIDLLIGVSLLLKRVLLNKPSIKRFTAWLIFVGMLLPYVEIFYGGTFYYGEVRDKQGLPFAVNNLGPIGSCLFFWYLFTADWLTSLPRKLGSYKNVSVSFITGGTILVATVFYLFGDW